MFPVDVELLASTLAFSSFEVLVRCDKNGASTNL